MWIQIKIFSETKDLEKGEKMKIFKMWHLLEMVKQAK